MLAYVFWHTPQEGTDPEAYEARLTAFHATLESDPPDGFLRSVVLRHYALPWAPPSMFVYEDWYQVDSFDALGALNDAAEEDARRDVHAAAAAAASWGAGGIFRPHVEGAPCEGDYVYWLSKSKDVGYEAFYDDIGQAAIDGLWQRQMVLGPAPEFCVLSDVRLDLDLPDVFESAGHTVYRSSR